MYFTECLVKGSKTLKPFKITSFYLLTEWKGKDALNLCLKHLCMVLKRYQLKLNYGQIVLSCNDNTCSSLFI